MYRFIISITIIILFFSSCNSQDLRTYYFNVAEFDKGKTYVFTNQNDTNQIQFWHMYSKVVNGDTLFITDGLDDKKRSIEIFIERIGNNETLMEDYYFIKYDSIGNKMKIPSNILKNKVYSFDYYKDPLVWSVTYDGDYGEEKMSKSRTILELDALQNIGGASYKCVLFRDEFKIFWKNSNQTYQFYQESYYAENFGLVRFIRTLPNGTKMDFQLTKIIENQGSTNYNKTYK